MSRKKILQVTSCFQFGGTEAYIMNNFRNINTSKYKFDFWFFRESNSPYTNEIISRGGSIYKGELPSIKRIFSFIYNLLTHIKKNGPYDAVHSHVNIANAWVMVAAFIAGVKVRISHSHDTSGKDSKNIFKKIHYIFQEYVIKIFATKKLACSKDAGDYLYGKNYFSKHGEVVNNGIDVEKFLNKDEEAIDKLIYEFKIPKGHFIIGNVTRFESKKNPEFTVDVFNEILKIHPNSILILGGVDGGQLAYIKEKVHKLCIEDKVRFIGVRRDVKDWLHIMDAYLFPSLYEGLGIVLLEAQAAGLSCFPSTGVSKEADMGLGLVHFFDLTKSAKYWAGQIIKNHKKNDLNSDFIRRGFDDHGYSIKSSINRINEIYGEG